MAHPLAVLLVTLLAAAYLAPLADAASCALLPACAAASSPCLSPDWTAAQACMRAIPFRDDWRNATVATLLAALENYGLRDIVMNAGPPYYTRTDVVGAVAATRSRAYANDIDFQEDIQIALASPQDAHTRYGKPACYDATLALPFVLNASLNAALPAPAAVVRLTLEASALLANYSALFPAVNVSGALGREVVLIDGVEAVTALATWADAFETRSNDPAIRFNAALRSFMYRSQRSLPRPAAPGGVVFTLADGSNVQLPWLVLYSASFGDVAACAAASSASASSLQSAAATRPSRLRVDSDLHAPPLHAPTLAAASAGSGNRATIIAPGASNSSISCFLQTTSGDKTTLVMKVGSFSPPGDDYLAVRVS